MEKRKYNKDENQKLYLIFKIDDREYDNITYKRLAVAKNDEELKEKYITDPELDFIEINELDGWKIKLER